MFREKWREDILPSIFTAITIFSILYLIRLGQNIVLTSFAASAFIVFTLPENVTAQPQNVLGGHLIGFMSAALTTILGKPA
ncbi:MAG: HPP family protein, partial [Aliifodinibius sp.]|nr:HPP family protein [Fodinibius sp.]